MSSSAVSWGNPVHDLRLGLASKDGTVTLSLENVGAGPLDVLSYVLAGEVHLDWYTLYLESTSGNRREMHLLGDRDRSAVVQAHLDPGASIRHEVDLAAWAVRPINGAQPLASGAYTVTAVYEVEPGAAYWSGRLEAGPITLTV